MIEIRTVQPAEAEEFLRLLCDVFELDVERARGVFFKEPMFDFDRKWALFEDGRMTSILTTVPLLFGWGRGVGIAGVATRKDRRGTGRAAHLLEHVLEQGIERGEGAAFLFARRTELYERVGFQVLDEVVRGRIRCTAEPDAPPALEIAEIERLYEAWADEHPDRLRRDERRWTFWKWNLRVCTAFDDGYLCAEAGVVRECVARGRHPAWPLPPRTEWIGLRTMSESQGVPLDTAKPELILMGYQAPGVPQMFMTDQF
jgi:N-acetylglutamate synthase-like GNAT family acetyltransferase